MKNLKIIAILLFTIVLFTNSYSQKKSTKVTLKSISDSNNVSYIVKNGKLQSEGSGGEGSTTYTYNKDGFFDFSGNVTYNLDGTVATKKSISRGNPNDPNSKIFLYTYSANTISEKVYQAANLSVVIEENNFVVQDGLIISKNQVGGKNKDIYKYDANGNVIFWRNERTPPNGIVMFHERTYTYDNHPSIQGLIFTGFYGKQVQLTSILLGGTDNQPSINNKLTCIDTSNYNFKKVAKSNTTNYSYTYATNSYPSSVSKNYGAGIALTTKYTY